MTAFDDMTVHNFVDEVLNETAMYTPDGGSATAVRVFRRTHDEAVQLLGARVQHTGQAFEVGTHEIASPAVGDTLVHDGTTYTVRDVAFGSHRLWALLWVE